MTPTQSRTCSISHALSQYLRVLFYLIPWSIPFASLLLHRLNNGCSVVNMEILCWNLSFNHYIFLQFLPIAGHTYCSNNSIRQPLSRIFPSEFDIIISITDSLRLSRCYSSPSFDTIPNFRSSLRCASATSASGRRI